MNIGWVTKKQFICRILSLILFTIAASCYASDWHGCEDELNSQDVSAAELIHHLYVSDFSTVCRVYVSKAIDTIDDSMRCVYSHPEGGNKGDIDEPEVGNQGMLQARLEYLALLRRDFNSIKNSPECDNFTDMRQKPSMPATTHIVSLGEEVTLNLQHENGDFYLQTGISLVTNSDLDQRISANLPNIRHELFLLLSSKMPSELRSIQGKYSLISEIISKVEQLIGKSGVYDVIFTDFYIQ